MNRRRPARVRRDRDGHFFLLSLTPLPYNNSPAVRPSDLLMFSNDNDGEEVAGVVMLNSSQLILREGRLGREMMLLEDSRGGRGERRSMRA